MESPEHSTDRLIALVRQGDEKAIGEALGRYREQLRRLSRGHLVPLLSRRVDASDVVQQTLMEAYQSIGRFNGQSEPEFLAWLRRILECNLAEAARNHLKVAKRAAWRERPLDGGSGPGLTAAALPSAFSSPSLHAIRSEQSARFLAALEHLPRDQREAVRLRHLEGWPVDRIAGQLGRSPEAVAGLLKRGLRALRVTLHGPGGSAA